ncbi:Peptidyl-prolyl cis-trans isomerase [Prochlorococcus sp. SS52]|nr:Peptidyl-prolyl cis-trans isomerase [Prochlorococcus sp. SS52]
MLVDPATAALPTGNRVKDPYAILRNSLPINQKELREIQHTLEDTSDLVRGNRWPAINQAASRSQFLVNTKTNQILQSIPDEEKNKGEKIISELKENLTRLNEEASLKNKSDFIEIRRKSLKEIGEIEALMLPEKFPHDIPKEFDSLPRLLGRASVNIKTTKGDMYAIIDGYNAPLTGGAFIDLVSKGFYDGLPMNRAEEFFVLQTGDPKGEAIGYINPETKEERHVPLEIRAPKKTETIYNQTFEELGLYTETPVLPFATLGTLGWAHSEQALDDGSSQFFFFLYEAELNPAGRNLIDGRNAAFGYVVEGEEILNELGVNDRILSIKVVAGSENLHAHA